MKLFLPQATLEEWAGRRKGRPEGRQAGRCRRAGRYPVTPAVHFVALVTGEDDQKLVAKVKTEVQLQALGAEQMADSVLLGETAYEVVPGYVAEVGPPPRLKAEPKVSGERTSWPRSSSTRCRQPFIGAASMPARCSPCLPCVRRRRGGVPGLPDPPVDGVAGDRPGAGGHRPEPARRLPGVTLVPQGGMPLGIWPRASPRSPSCCWRSSWWWTCATGTGDRRLHHPAGGGGAGAGPAAGRWAGAAPGRHAAAAAAAHHHRPAGHGGLRRWPRAWP